jgi:hypothetical protein
MSRKGWRKAIEKALQKKGFTKEGAKKTAIMTVERSVECRKRGGIKFTPSANKEQATRYGAIYQKSPMVGKIVVIPPKI